MLAMLRNIRNLRIINQHIVSITYEDERISIKNSLYTLLKMCVTSLLCGPRADLWPFYGVLCKKNRPVRRDVTHILSKVSCFLVCLENTK